jgi:3-oxoacyl-[acyl-carrier-protein] synthase-3
MVANEAVLAKLRAVGVETNGKNGEDTERLVGIRTRWWSNLSSTEHALAASRAAVADARRRNGNGFRAEKLRLVHSGGSSPDNLFPACACEIQGALEVPPEHCEARDVSLACSSWVDALLLAASRMRDKEFRYGLVAVGESVGTRLNAPTSLSHCLWGDGGGATVLEYDPEGDPATGFLADRALSDGQFAHWTRSLKIGTHPHHEQYPFPDASMLDHGRDIHRYAIRMVSQAVAELLEEHGLEGEEPYLVPHNANLGMVRQIGKRLGIPEERVLTRVVERGNTSSASIPITLAHYAARDHFQPGDLLILAAFGGGMAINLMLYRWS